MVFVSGMNANGALEFDFIKFQLTLNAGEFEELVAFMPFAIQLCQPASVKMRKSTHQSELRSVPLILPL
jgi:hypothetical protein